VKSLIPPGKPNPVRLREELGTDAKVDEHRAQGPGDGPYPCPFYDECLWKAAKENWRSFTCTQCQLFTPMETRPAPEVAEVFAEYLEDLG